MSSDHALSSLDTIGLAQLQLLADHPQLFASAGQLAVQLSQLQAQNVAIVDGFVLPTSRFMQHCQRAAIPTTFELDTATGQTWQTLAQQLAQQCQSAIRQTSCADWLPQLALTWQRSALNYPLVVVRPSFGGALPSAASDLLTPQIGAIDELEPMLKALWSEVFCARNLRYWSQYCGDLGQLPLATLIQPLRTIVQSGRLWVTDKTLMVERFWGVQWLGHPQEIDVPVRVIDRSTGQGRSSPANPQQLVHAILGHWPPALPLTVPLIVAGDQWLLPHPVAAGTDDRWPESPVPDAMFVALAEAIDKQVTSPLRVDWQYSHGQLQVQAMYPGEVAPLTARLAPLNDDPVMVMTGLAAAPGLGLGRAVVVAADQTLTVALTADCILVTPQLRPDWLPLIQQAAGLVTEQGGMTSHGAVVARSLGIPAIVGVAQATQVVRSGDWLKLEAGQVQQLSAAGAQALLAAGRGVNPIDAAINQPVTQTSSTQLLASIIHPSQAASLGQSGWDGIGLVRGEHLLAAELEGCSPWEPLVMGDQERLSRALGRSLRSLLAVGDMPVWYRLSDWRSHEMPVGTVVPVEVNPALGMHGGLYYQHFPEWLAVELGAIERLDQRSRSRLRLVLPFVRTAAEVRTCMAAMAAAGVDDVALWIMAEVPAIVYALPECAAAGIQGIAIGLNDLMQLWFGVDREAGLMTDFFDPSHVTVRSVVRSGLQHLIQTARSLDLACTVCSVPPDAALIGFLVECGVTGIVVNPPDRHRVAQILHQSEV